MGDFSIPFILPPRRKIGQEVKCLVEEMCDPQMQVNELNKQLNSE